jgi:DNA-binding response OmpR family regulator
MTKKILVIDDDFDILEPISLILEEEGYLVETMTKGERSIKKVNEFKPDLILLDMLLSGSDGRKICAKLKGSSKSNRIPIVMMSAHPGAEKESKTCGADSFLAKPFETKDLINIVKEYSTKEPGDTKLLNEEVEP